MEKWNGSLCWKFCQEQLGLPEIKIKIIFRGEKWKIKRKMEM
jgi:hypothetical protein